MENLHKGHRARVRRKFCKAGLAAFEEHEILELILFYAIPQRDTNELAHKLVKRFGSLKNVLEAPGELLTQEKGVGENVAVLLRLFSAVARHCELAGAAKLNFGRRWSVIDAMISKFEGRQKEELYVLCLDSKLNVVAMKGLLEGEIKNINISWEKVVRYIMLNNVSNVVLFHNHPNGVPIPSSNDVFFTRKLIEILKPLNIGVQDHIIISGQDYASMKEMELLNEDL